MVLIYFVVSFILGVVTYVCSQLDWQYGYILMYIFLFLTSWYISLVFVYQEEYERSKKFTLLTPPHLIILIIDIGLIAYYWKYNIKDFETIKYAKYKAVVLMNLIQSVVQMLYFKLRSVYIHL